MTADPLLFDIGRLAFAFWAGMVAAFNPCGAAMFPAYVGYQLGSAEGSRNPLIAAFKGVVLGLAATVGFVVVFAIVGIILAAGGRMLQNYLPFAGLAVGAIITALGLWLLISRRRIGIAAASRVNLGAGRGIKQVFLFGIAYAVASLSCALPIFVAAVGIVFVAGTHSLDFTAMAQTFVGSLSYGLGMGVIMIAAAIGVVFFKELVQRLIRKVLPLVEPVGHLAMIGAGIYLIHYWVFGTGRELLNLRLAEVL